LIYSYSSVSVFAVTVERPWFKDHHGDTVFFWELHFFGGARCAVRGARPKTVMRPSVRRHTNSTFSPF
jgi:hypothetical protein